MYKQLILSTNSKILQHRCNLHIVQVLQKITMFAENIQCNTNLGNIAIKSHWRCTA